MKKLVLLILSLVMVISAMVVVSGAAETEGGMPTVAHHPETVLADGSVETIYGTIPAANADAKAYPLVVFMNGTFKGADSVFAKDKTGAYQIAKNLMDNDSERNNHVQIYFRGNVSIKGRHTNSGQMSGTLTVDLNGYTASCGSYMMYDAVAKKYNEIHPLKVITKNGYITTTAPLLNCSAYGEAYADLSEDVKTMQYDFENVKITRTGGELDFIGKYVEPSTVTTGKKTITPVNFRNCEIDLTGATEGITVFNALDPDTTQSNNVLKITVEGCVFRMKNVNAFNWYNTTEGNDSFVTFKADEKGNYPTLILPKSADAPTAKIPMGDSEMPFVKTGETAEGYIYKAGVLAASDFGFKVKTSITLDSQVTLNIYATDNSLASFVLDGVKYTDLDKVDTVEVGGETYYHVSVPFASDEMLKSVVFTADLESNDYKQSFDYTLGIPKYTSRILADNSVSANTKLLAADVLSYARAAYNYFDGSADELKVLDAILDKDHDKMSTVTTVPVAPTETPGLKSATLVLGDKPAIRFYLPDGANASDYDFYIGGYKIKTTYNATENYIDTDVYAYALCETVTYTVKGEEAGSYSVGNYYYHAKNVEKNDKLTTLVERFIKYLESARTYRLEVLGDPSAVHTHTLFERSFEMTAYNPAYTEKVCACTYSEKTQLTGLDFGDEKVTVYFLGNSYTNYNDMSLMFGSIASSMGIDVDVIKRTKGSWHLWKFQNPNDEGGVTFHEDLANYDFDYAFLQDGSTQTLAAIAEFYDGVRLVGELIEKDGATPILYQTWGRKAGHSVLEKYGLDTDSMARTVAAAYEAIARETGYTNSPAGSAFLDVYTNHPEIELYDPDLTHPSATGSYLVALCHYATLFGRSPIGVEYTNGIDADTALILQTAAYNAVFGESIVTDEYKTSSEGIHVAKAENNLYEIPEGSELISVDIKGTSGVYAPDITVAKDGTLTDAQRAEMSNIANGISIIGNKNMVTSFTRAADGAWNNAASNRLSFDFDGNNYDISGDVDMHEPYKALITYNFGRVVNITAIGYMSGNMAGFAQTQDVYISNDGISWVGVKSGCYDAVLLGKENGSLHSLNTIPTDKNGNTPGVCVAFDMNSAEGGVYAQYVRFGIKQGIVGEDRSYDINTLELAVWGKVEPRTISELPEDSVLISQGLTASEEFSATVDGVLAELTAEQKVDIADMTKYGLTMIGAKTLARSIKYACDGVWSGTNRLTATFYDDGDKIVKYDINGNVSENGKYEALLTYNFGEKVTLDAIGYMSGDLNGFAQAQEVWVSDDGINWTRVISAGYNRVAGDLLESVSNKPIDKDGTGKASGQCVMFDMGGVQAQYVRVAITEGMTMTTSSNDLNTYELAVYGKREQ